MSFRKPVLYFIIFQVVAIPVFADSPVTRLPDGRIILSSLSSGKALKSPYRKVPDEILVRYRKSISASSRASIHAKLGTKVVKEFKHVGGVQLVKLPPGMTVQRATNIFLKRSEVLYAEPNYLIEADSTPNDPQFSMQWGLNNTRQFGGIADADIDAPEAWDLTTGNADAVIAVIDSGVDYTHPDLAPNMLRNTVECDNNSIDDDGNGYIDDCYGINVVAGNSDPMDDQYHGTHIAGIIGAAGNNAAGVVGVNWTTRILACKFLDADGYGTTAGAIACLDYVTGMKDRGINIIASNNSWSGGAYSQALYDAIDAQRRRGILFVASAGNNSADNDIAQTYPCSYDQPNIICVASTNDYDRLSISSNYGKRVVHLGAPGENIISTVPGSIGDYAYLSGTSTAAPHVTGVAGLIHALYPGSDWRTVKNRILAGSDVDDNLTQTVTGRRLNAYGALTCSNSTVIGRLRPLGTSLTAGSGPIALSVLHINCANPNGDVTVTVSPTGETATLLDDGLGNDLVAGDGIYSGSWTPPSSGTFVLSFPNGDNVTVDVDFDLETGFPVKAWHYGGAAVGGPEIHTLVANINDNSGFQILTTGLSSGPLYAWDSRGIQLPGWPVDTVGTAYPSAGELSTASTGSEIVISSSSGSLSAVDGLGIKLPGWPRNSALYNSNVPSLADIDGDGLDEIFIEDEQFHGYRADGTDLGWPSANSVTGRTRPAIADLDGDGDLEIITIGKIDNKDYLLAYHHTGTYVTGFPASVNGYGDTVVGDVNGDGQPEIVIAGPLFTTTSFSPIISIYSSSGVLISSIPLTSKFYQCSAPALADLDGDGIYEIIVQTDEALYVFRGNGTNFPGWPVEYDQYTSLRFSSPVVGDVDGDGFPDIVVTTSLKDNSETGYVRVYNRNGISHPHFPKSLQFGSGAVPAISDIDTDGHNEIVITGSLGIELTGYFDKVWVFDLRGPSHGPTLWGQFRGNARHTGTATTVYPTIREYRLLSLTAGSGGVVTSNPSGINCGSYCSRDYVGGTSVILTARASTGYRFDRWDGACADHPGNTCTLVMDTDKSVSVQYAILPYKLTVNLEGSGSGTVISDSPGINCGNSCTGTYNFGTSITLTATSENGSTFSGWSGACSGTGTYCLVTVSSDTNVIATFQKNVPAPVSTGNSTGSTNSVGSKKSGGGGCFIATAAYGSYMAADVVVLRNFRDRHLLTNSPGRTFVKWYYRFSPPVADFIARHKSLRTATRAVLFPIIFTVKHPLAAFLVFMTPAIFITAWKAKCVFPPIDRYRKSISKSI